MMTGGCNNFKVLSLSLYLSCVGVYIMTICGHQLSYYSEKKIPLIMLLDLCCQMQISTIDAPRDAQ